jgi:hypothetical protein
MSPQLAQTVQSEGAEHVRSAPVVQTSTCSAYCERIVDLDPELVLSIYVSFPCAGSSGSPSFGESNVCFPPKRRGSKPMLAIHSARNRAYCRVVGG